MPEPYQIEAVVPGPSNAIRSHDHPMIESGNLSFPDARYLLELLPGDDRSSYTVTHRIEGAPLIARLLERQQARYACIVSSPISAYRETHVSTDARQTVTWDPDDLGEAPLFTPVILCSESQELKLDSSRDGLHPIWDNQTIVLHKGSRLALGSVIQLESSILHLLSFHEDARLDEGQFAVDTETEPFRFRVNLSSGLHRFLRYPTDENHHNIMTHVVTACLALLQRSYADDDGESGWRTHRNLVALAEYLDQRGLDHWSDDNFRPEHAATGLYPLRVPAAVSEQNEMGEAA